MKGIVLLSGGLDSTLVLLKLLKDGREVVPMFVDYDQWSLEGELKATTEVVEWASHPHFEGDSDRCTFLSPGFHLKDLVEIRLGWKEEEKVGSVWGRSIALVGLAAMWAYTHGDDYDFIALGNHKGDVGPDCKPGHFDYCLRNTLSEATKAKLDLILPIEELTVEDIGKELAEFGIPWNLMYSCYWYPPCGYKSENEEYRCPGCRRKYLAMRAAGIDMEESARPNCEEVTYQSPLSESPGY